MTVSLRSLGMTVSLRSLGMTVSLRSLGMTPVGALARDDGGPRHCCRHPERSRAICTCHPERRRGIRACHSERCCHSERSRGICRGWFAASASQFTCEPTNEPTIQLANSPKKGSSPRKLPRDGSLSEPSRHLHAAWSARDLPRVQAPRAHLHLRDLAIYQRAHHLQVRLPRAPRLVVRVRDVVAEGDALVAVVAAIALNGHGLSPDRTRFAPSRRRHPCGGRS